MQAPFDGRLKCVEVSRVEMKAVVQSEGTARMRAPSQWVGVSASRATCSPVWLEATKAEAARGGGNSEQSQHTSCGGEFHRTLRVMGTLNDCSSSEVFPFS